MNLHHAAQCALAADKAQQHMPTGANPTSPHCSNPPFRDEVSGCPANADHNWSLQEIKVTVTQGPHALALEQDAKEQLQCEVDEKVCTRQAKAMFWDDIHANLPPELKILPIAMIPHKSCKNQATLNMSFGIRLQNGTTIPSIKEGTILSAPNRAIDQSGHH